MDFYVKPESYDKREEEKEWFYTYEKEEYGPYESRRQALEDAVYNQHMVRPIYFVSAYEVTRNYGGPEEGGWWWNSAEVITTMPATNETADEIVDFFKKHLADVNRGDIYSSLGGEELLVCKETFKHENERVVKPMWC